MRTLLLAAALLAPPAAAAQRVGQNLNIAAWLRQVRALGDNASEEAQRRLALQLDPDLPSVCETDEITGWVAAQSVGSTATLVTIGCSMGARRSSFAPYALQRVSGRWQARRLQMQTFYGQRLGTEATMMGDLEVSGGNIVFTAFYGPDGYTTYRYRLPTLGEPPVLVLLRATESSTNGPSRVIYRRRGSR